MVALLFRDAARKRPLCTIPSMIQVAVPIRSPIHAPAHPFNRRPLFYPKKIDLQPLHNTNQASTLLQHSYVIVHAKLSTRGFFSLRHSSDSLQKRSSPLCSHLFLGFLILFLISYLTEE
jgi:hypothetical protein